MGPAARRRRFSNSITSSRADSAGATAWTTRVYFARLTTNSGRSKREYVDQCIQSKKEQQQKQRALSDEIFEKVRSALANMGYRAGQARRNWRRGGSTSLHPGLKRASVVSP
jgi:hypothetical protein